MQCSGGYGTCGNAMLVEPKHRVQFEHQRDGGYGGSTPQHDANLDLNIRFEGG